MKFLYNAFIVQNSTFMVPHGFFTFYCHFPLILENSLQLYPPPQDFDKITPLPPPCLPQNLRGQILTANSFMNKIIFFWY